MQNDHREERRRHLITLAQQMQRVAEYASNTYVAEYYAALDTALCANPLR